MTILARYISVLFLSNLFLSLAILVGLYFFQAIIGQMIDEEWALSQIAYYNSMDIPAIIVQMTPPATLLATVLTLSGLSRTNELVACFSIGVGLFQVMTIILTLVFMVSCVSVMMQDQILPALFKKRTVYYWRDLKGRQDFFLDVKQDKIWYRSKNLIYNLQRFDSKSKTIKGLDIYTFDPAFRLIEVVAAKTAQFTPTGWILQNGVTTTFAKEDHFPITENFEDRKLKIAETPKDFQEIEKEVDGLRFKELWHYIGRMKETGTDTKAYEVKFHSRLSMSFIPIVMAILAIPFSTRGRREGGTARDFGICLGVTFFYWLFYSIGLSLGTNGTLSPWLAAWLPSVIFGALAIGLIYQTKR